ncbi:hypothetical protein EDD85DRAFT_791110 [Armillaria nabsnona]|nr:hypothetical protein EDD85DRAFT_791110 [Armillaria nabsnona]
MPIILPEVEIQQLLQQCDAILPNLQEREKDIKLEPLRKSHFPPLITDAPCQCSPFQSPEPPPTSSYAFNPSIPTETWKKIKKKNNAKNKKAMEELMATLFFRQMAGFSDNALANFYPELHNDYHNVLDTLCDNSWDLHCNFIECVWAATTINFGPTACIDHHTDFLNLVQAMCTIWALGNFDEKKGSCILLPSALLEHSNLLIHKGESRCSFVMYLVAGLFHWVEIGMQSNVDVLTNGSEDARKAWME